MVKRVVNVVVLPLTGGMLARLVELTDGSGRVETWDGAAWVHRGADAWDMLTSPSIRGTCFCGLRSRLPLPPPCTQEPHLAGAT